MAEKPVLVLALGNDLIADDALGPVAAELLAPHLPPQVALKVCAAAGMELLEELVGFEAAIIVDAVQTGKKPPGTIHRWELSDLAPVQAPSAHWAGLPEAQAVAQHLGLPFPRHVVIFAVEAEDLRTIGKPLSPPVREAASFLVQEVLREVPALLCQPKAGLKACESALFAACGVRGPKSIKRRRGQSAAIAPEPS